MDDDDIYVNTLSSSHLESFQDFQNRMMGQHDCAPWVKKIILGQHKKDNLDLLAAKLSRKATGCGLLSFFISLHSTGLSSPRLDKAMLSIQGS